MRHRFRDVSQRSRRGAWLLAQREQGGSPPFDTAMMFKILIIQAVDNLSDERAGFLINNRISFMRFLGLTLAIGFQMRGGFGCFATSSAKQARSRGCSPVSMSRASGYIAITGQIVDATLVAAPKQRNNEEEKTAIKEGRIPNGWGDNPA